MEVRRSLSSSFKVEIKAKLATLPKKPGCYLMKNANGKIIYVGKAINLRNRVNSYFKGAHDYKTTKLVSHIDDFEYIVTKSEKEALILEYNLIKEYDPEYNIVFKDDKSYPYILLSDDNQPYCSVVRLKKHSKFKGRLFGPYPDVAAARNTVAMINKLFKTRKCERLKKDLCLYYHIDQCPGYCKFEIDEQVTSEIKEKILTFLNGDVAFITNDLRKKMDVARDNLDFEKAIEYRDLIDDINHIILRQDVQTSNRESFDVFAYDVKDGYFSIVALFIKNGRLLNHHRYIDFLVGDIENAVSAYIYQFYTINQHPKKLYVPNNLLPFLKDAFGFETKSASRGHKRALIKQAQDNAKTYLEQNKSIIQNSERYYDDIANELLRIFKKPIQRIDLFDNSHISGTNTVAALVVYENLKPSKKDYRHFKLEEGSDDLKSMHEVLYRNYFRVLKDGLKRPDLLIVDGARNQIKVAKEVLNDLGMMDIKIVGLGKDEHHNTAYLMNDDYAIIKIQKDSNLFFFLTNIQDEVHRFAISYHRKLRSKTMTKSLLDDVEGLGEKRKILLRRKFKSIAQMRSASLNDLAVILPKKVAENLFAKLHQEE